MSTFPLITAIVAMSENRVIGKENTLPWHLPADLQHFKSLTWGHPIIMGRKTYESIGRPLPGRTNIVLTRDKQFEAPGCVVVSSLPEALSHASVLTHPQVFIIGGAQIYQQALPFLSRINLTMVHIDIAGDAYFPMLSANEWQETERHFHPADEKNNYAYSFITLERINAS